MFRSRHPVPERRATGEVARVYHEVRSVLRVTGVNLVFRRWAAIPDALPPLWDALRPNLETRAFEDAADMLRAATVAAADGLGRLGAAGRVELGESQASQLDGALALYHYVNPKLLVMVSTAALALEGEPLRGTGPIFVERVERHAPAAMAPMELVPERPGDRRLRRLFREIRSTLRLESVNSDYRTLALWPDYLEAVWTALTPIATSEAHAGRAADLIRRSRDLARGLPLPVPLSRESLREQGVDPDEVLETTRTFERVLAGLVINMTLVGLDRRSPEELKRSPFPAAARGSAGRAA